MKLFILILTSSLLPIYSLISVYILNNRCDLDEVGKYFFSIVAFRIISSWVGGGLINYYVKLSQKNELIFNYIMKFLLILILESAIISVIFNIYIPLKELNFNHFFIIAYLSLSVSEFFLLAILRRNNFAFEIFVISVVPILIALYIVYISIDIDAYSLMLINLFRIITTLMILIIFLINKLECKIIASNYSFKNIYGYLYYFKVTDFFRSISSNYDKQLIVFLLNQSSLAIYGLIQQVTNILLLFFGSIANIWFPKIIDNRKDGNENFKDTLSFTLYFTGFSFILFMIFSNLVYELIFNVFYNIDQNSYSIYFLLCTSSIIFLPYLLLGSLISYEGETKYVFKISVISIMLGMFISLLFIHQIGTLSVAFGLFLSNFFQSTFIVLKFIRIHQIKSLSNLRCTLIFAKNIFYY